MLSFKKSLLIFVFFASTAQAQKASVDSLKNLINKTNQPAIKARNYLKIYSLLEFDDISKAKTYLDKAARLQGNNDTIRMLLSLQYSLYNQNIGLADTSLFYGLKAKKLALKFKDDITRAQAAGAVANAYLQKRDFKKAQSAYLEAMPVYTKTNNYYALGNLHVNLGYLFQQQGLVAEAEKYYQQAKDLFVKIDNQERLAQLYNNYGILYAENNDLKKSLAFFQVSTKIREKLTNKINLANSYLNMGGITVMMKKYQQAESYLIKSRKLFSDMNNVQGISSCLTNLGEIQEQTKNYPRALAYYKESLALAKANDNMEDVENVLSSISKVYKALGEYQKAFEYSDELNSLKDTLYKKSLTSEIAEMQTKYETANKEQQIKLLNKENIIQKLSLSSRSKTLFIIVVLFIMSVVFAIMFYSRYKSKQDARLKSEIIRQQDLSTKAVLDAEEKERIRIASDLHDGVGQLFSVVKMNLSVMIDRGQIITPKDQLLAEKTLALVDESCKEVRSISHQMMPNILLRSGLASALKSFIDKIDAERLKVNLEVVGLNETLNINVENVLYRVIQETVNNVIKHSRASTLNIQLQRNESSINVSVQDNGKGFVYNEHRESDGIGLKNIITRVKYLQGQVEIQSEEGKGTLIKICVPV